MFTQALLLAAVSALASAQSSVLSFTHVPNPITDGQAQAITYDTNDTSSPVTIILRKGQSSNLQTIQTLTTTATDGQFVWTPSSSLADGDDYALEITQGSQNNYYGPFSIEGATTSSSSSSSAPAGYPTSSMTMSSSTSSSVSGYITSTANATTTVLPYGTAPGSSAGTGTTMPRNTTMSSATLSTKKSSSTPASMSASGTAAGSPTASTGGATAASSTSSSAASAALSGSSSLALVFGAIAAIFYLQ